MLRRAAERVQLPRGSHQRTTPKEGNPCTTPSSSALLSELRARQRQGLRAAPQGLRARHPPPIQPMRWMLVAVGVVLLTTALSIVGAAHRGAALCEVAKMAEYGFVFAAVALAFANDPDERPFWIALCGTTAIVCLGALAQYLVGAHSEVVLGGQAIPRIAGPLEGPNQLAGYLEIVLPLLLARSVLGGGAIVIGRDGSGGRRCADAFTTGIRGRRDRRTDRARPARSAQVCGARHARDRSTRRRRHRGGGPGRCPSGYYSVDPTPAASTHLANRMLLWRAAIALWERSPIVGRGRKLRARARRRRPPGNPDPRQQPVSP